MVARDIAGNYMPDQVYRALDQSREMRIAVSDDYYDLPHQAYDARRAGAEYRFAFAGEVVAQIIGSGPMEQGWVHRAEALHLVSVPMLNEVEPRKLVELLAPALGLLIDQRHDFPGLHRYCALLLRTISLAASKLDEYTVAFAFMNKAHAQLATAQHARSQVYVAEAWQQTYLQECGQLSRNVEAALLEQNRETTRQNLLGRLPNRRLNTELELRPMRIAARAAAESGRRATTLIEFVKTNEGLPGKVDPEKRRLAVSSWFVTCSIMYMRALLIAGLIELCANADPSRYLLRVPAVWASVIERHPTNSDHDEPRLENSHRMDLTRNALVWAFLHSGEHPYVPTTYAQMRAGVPDYLHRSSNSKLDTVRCANEIAKHGHNGGILDNLAHVDTCGLLFDRGGAGPLGYHAWLDHRRSHLSSVVDVHDPDPEQLRTVGKPTLHVLRTSAKMVSHSRRYDKVLRDL